MFISLNMQMIVWKDRYHSYVRSGTVKLHYSPQAAT